MCALVILIFCYWLETEGPRVRASPASLRCGPWARHIYPSLVLVQPRKTRPYITERLLMGRKESNQTNHLLLKYLFGICLCSMFISLSNLSICSKMVNFVFSAYFGGHFCYHKSNLRLLHFGYCSNKLRRTNWWKTIFIF